MTTFIKFFIFFYISSGAITSAMNVKEIFRSEAEGILFELILDRNLGTYGFRLLNNSDQLIIIRDSFFDKDSYENFAGSAWIRARQNGKLLKSGIRGISDDVSWNPLVIPSTIIIDSSKTKLHIKSQEEVTRIFSLKAFVNAYLNSTGLVNSWDGDFLSLEQLGVEIKLIANVSLLSPNKDILFVETPWIAIENLGGSVEGTDLK